jgi:hypothetical protein
MRILFQTLPNGFGEYAIVRGKNMHGEYVVSLYVVAIARHVKPRAEYFTNDYDDACATALHMTRQRTCVADFGALATAIQYECEYAQRANASADRQAWYWEAARAFVASQVSDSAR